MEAFLQEQLRREGTVQFTVRAVPGAAKTRIMEVMDDESVKIAVAAPPEKGKANAELIKFLAKEFSVAKGNVEIVAGKTARVKLVRVKR
ncbi:MAG: DUF167 domain-containing protein [Candidatus Peribacteraceae bacterium]|jgi:hypothetical protein